jgi:iron complex transport system permease protein
VRARPLDVLLWCGVALVVAMALGVELGSSSAGIEDLFDGNATGHFIVVDLRLSETVLAALAGAGLAAVGAAFQTVLRNPLAEPYVLGVSGGSALGATIALLAVGNAGLLGAAGVPAAAFVGGVAATALVGSLALATGATGASILLAGIVVNAMAGAGITLLEALAEPGRLPPLVRWLMGYVEPRSWDEIGFVAVFVAVGLAVLLRDAARTNLLALGDEPAASLGLDVRALERRTMLACAAVVGAVVSLTGLIGFVGLVVPQAVRRIVGPDLRVVLPASALGGGAVLVLCDLLVRLLERVLHQPVPVGALTALAGGPVFLALLRRRTAVA